MFTSGTNGMETCQEIPPAPNPSTPRVFKLQYANFEKKFSKGNSSRKKSLAQMKEREKCKKEPSPTSVRQMVLEILHFKVRNLSNMDIAIL